jgi:hypothetical protein
MRDDLLAKAKKKQVASEEIPSIKVGRNDPCPCGSGKKYKRCCMDMHEQVRRNAASEQVEDLEERQQEQSRLVELIEKTFGLYAAGKNQDAIRSASKLLKKYPNEDRLHDIVATSRLAEGNFDQAVEICKNRLQIAQEEKDYFVNHGRYRDAEIDEPALSYYYPPITWLQKYWIALKAKEYHAFEPENDNKTIISLANELKIADDPNRFPQKHAQGMDIRREALKETLEKLQTAGDEIVPYLLPIACRYSWAGLFVPEVLSHYRTELAVCGLMDISMFGFAYASGASLHYLEQLGEEVIPRIEEAFSRDKTFDPIKTGLVSVLGNVRSEASYELLIRLLENENHHIVNWAGDALGKFRKTEALPPMMAAARRIGGEKMIDEAIEKLKDLA